MDFKNLLPKIPLSTFTKEQKRSAILSWVSYNSKIKLKYYEVPKNNPTARSTDLWQGGRAEKGNKVFMVNRIKQNISLHILAADTDKELKEIVDNISDGIIEQALIVCEDMFNAALKAKTKAVRKKYFNAIENIEYLKIAFILGVCGYAKELKSMGIDIRHKTLSIRLDVIDNCKNELNYIWKTYAESNKDINDYLEAQEKTEKIFEKYEKKMLINTADIEQLANEKLIYELMGEENLNKLINMTVDRIRENITGYIRLFENY